MMSLKSLLPGAIMSLVLACLFLVQVMPIAAGADGEGEEGGEVKEEPIDTVLCFSAIFMVLIVALAAGILLLVKYIIVLGKESNEEHDRQGDEHGHKGQH